MHADLHLQGTEAGARRHRHNLEGDDGARYRSTRPAVFAGKAAAADAQTVFNFKLFKICKLPPISISAGDGKFGEGLVRKGALAYGLL